VTNGAASSSEAHQSGRMPRSSHRCRRLAPLVPCRGEVARHGYVVAVGGVVLGLVMAAGAEAQSTFERGWIDVNFGVAVAAEHAFSMRATGELFDEPADFSADYALPPGASFDFGVGHDHADLWRRSQASLGRRTKTWRFCA
jgi:hypothetical protein